MYNDILQEEVDQVLIRSYMCAYVLIILWYAVHSHYAKKGIHTMTMTIIDIVSNDRTLSIERQKYGEAAKVICHELIDLVLLPSFENMTKPDMLWLVHLLANLLRWYPQYGIWDALIGHASSIITLFNKLAALTESSDNKNIR